MDPAKTFAEALAQYGPSCKKCACNQDCKLVQTKKATGNKGRYTGTSTLYFLFYLALSRILMRLPC
jgi:hypothetical protein